MDSKRITEKRHFIDLESGRSETDDIVDSSNSTEKLFNSERENTRRKSSKPPRPPKTLPLLVADQSVAQEISKHAMLKQGRIGRMKAFKNKKRGKLASSNSNFCALVITIIFCGIMIWQGVCSRSKSKGKFHGLSESSLESLVEFHRNLSAGPLPSRFRF